MDNKLEAFEISDIPDNKSRHDKANLPHDA
jgi:hypothetical protein